MRKWRIVFNDKSGGIELIHVDKGVFTLTSIDGVPQFIENTVKSMYPGMHCWDEDITELITLLWNKRTEISIFFDAGFTGGGL